MSFGQMSARKAHSQLLVQAIAAKGGSLNTERSKAVMTPLLNRVRAGLELMSNKLHAAAYADSDNESEIDEDKDVSLSRGTSEAEKNVLTALVEIFGNKEQAVKILAGDESDADRFEKIIELAYNFGNEESVKKCSQAQSLVRENREAEIESVQKYILDLNFRQMELTKVHRSFYQFARGQVNFMTAEKMYDAFVRFF